MPTIISGDGTITGLTTTGISAVQQLPAGSVIQVVNAIDTTDQGVNTSTFTDTSVTATITPKYATSKILVIVDINGMQKATNDTYAIARLVRNASTALVQFCGFGGQTGNTSTNGFQGASASYLDSPATTSATSYKVQIASASNNAIVYIGLDAYSTITLMEIAQ